MFDKEKRAELHAWLSESHDAHEDIAEYVKALEEVAKAAMVAWKDGLVLSSAQEGALYDSLSKVDWMEEEKENQVTFVREWNCHFHATCLPDTYPTLHNVQFTNERGMDHVVCQGCRQSVGQVSSSPRKGHAPSYVENAE